jgi:putative endonuclease
LNRNAKAFAQIVVATSNRDPFAHRTPSLAIPRLKNALPEAEMPAYSVYLVRCRDGSLYTGIATDVSRRITEHENGAKGAKYLRGRGPLKLVYQQEIGDRSLASKVESRVKRLSRSEKADPRGLSDRIDGILLELSTSAG